MTTYPLSEPATIYGSDGVAGRATLAECAEIAQGFSAETRKSARIEMDDLALQFGPAEIDELLRYLNDEDPGLSNQEIAALPDPDL